MYLKLCSYYKIQSYNFFQDVIFFLSKAHLTLFISPLPPAHSHTPPYVIFDNFLYTYLISICLQAGHMHGSCSFCLSCRRLAVLDAKNVADVMHQHNFKQQCTVSAGSQDDISLGVFPWHPRLKGSWLNDIRSKLLYPYVNINISKW